jgi:choline dehydrogenase-like flavoprotein
MNWFYKTVPQTHLAGQEIDYSRGKGLGGSTAINFCGWTVGPRDDYDEWANIVRDERFAWKNVQRVLKKSGF